MKGIIAALAVVSLAHQIHGCDIFVSDWGSVGQACLTEGDCQEGLFCNDYNHCTQYGFGKPCVDRADCAGNIGWEECLCTDDLEYGIQCRCTKECHEHVGTEGCDEEQPGTRWCALANIPEDTVKMCMSLSWSSGIGAYCPDNDCPGGLQCMAFHRVGFETCTASCADVDCPEGMHCGELGPGGGTNVCGYPPWFGYFAECLDDNECQTNYPQYPYCHETQQLGWRCTHTCGHPDECPDGSTCEPTDGAQNVCVAKPFWP